MNDNELKEAFYWKREENKNVTCLLCPRNCVIKEGGVGFCRTRTNQAGTLYSLNYGCSVTLTEESIETEAVYHYMPGAKILSLGNIGCMMNCDFCQNWETSQMRHVDMKNVIRITPEEVVDAALKRGIRILSWTYNDPVVWHEFVIDTAKLAKERGLLNLYKSALYISEEAVRELCSVIDIFSISLKSMNDEFYRNITKATLFPVLDAIKIVSAHKKHLEISQLVVTDLNDHNEEFLEISRWVRDNLGRQTPLHFVRFHPAYKYKHVSRTPLDKLYQAKDIAEALGLQYVYIGNLYKEGAADTLCPFCKTVLVERFGLKIQVRDGLSEHGSCLNCGEKNNIFIENQYVPFKDLGAQKQELKNRYPKREGTFHWDSEINAVHLSIDDTCRAAMIIIHGDESQNTLFVGKDFGVNRILVTRSNKHERFLTYVYYADQKHTLKIWSLLDRAHFPVDSQTHSRNNRVRSSFLTELN
jgi:pyruvate formate lyase activating enzyme